MRAGDWDRLPVLAPLVELDGDPETAPSELLRPRYGVVPFVDREQLLNHLMLWRESDARLRVAVLSAGGGFGKTGTAMEVCRLGWPARPGWSEVWTGTGPG